MKQNNFQKSFDAQIPILYPLCKIALPLQPFDGLVLGG